MRTVAISEAFDRRLFRFLKQHRDLEKKVNEILRLLEIDLNTSSLKTHKLHGKMHEFYGCSINYHYRIVFKFDNDFIYPESIGSHDDVY